MNAYTKMLKTFQQADYNTLLSAARTAADRLCDHCKTTVLPCGQEELLGYIMLSGVGADGKLSQKEKQFLIDVLQIEESQVSRLIAGHSKDLATYVDHFADNGNAEVKGAILTLIAAIAAADKNISAEENELLRKILK